MGMSTARRSWGRSGFPLALMLAAVLAWIMVTAGTMVSRAQAGPALVICTGHGPLTLDPPGGAPARKAPKTKDQASCAFAGHGIGGPTPDLLGLTATPVAVSLILAMSGVDAVPGQGLAAPPPYAQAPPSAI